MAEITLLIETIGDELEVTVETENPPNTQKGRRGAPITGKPHGRSREIKEQKINRRQHADGGHDDTHLSAGPHQTMILLEGQSDRVTFKCAKPFVVDVEFDPAYQDPHEPEPRRSPFKDWNTPQSSKQETPASPHLAFGEFINDKREDSAGHSIDGTRPTDYRFYKMTVWCDGLKMDPDWYCDR